MIERRKEIQVNTVPEMADKHLDLRSGPEMNETNKSDKFRYVCISSVQYVVHIIINCFTLHARPLRYDQLLAVLTKLSNFSLAIKGAGNLSKPLKCF